MTQKNPPSGLPWTLLQYVIVIGLMIIPLAISIQAISDFRELRYLNEIFGHGEKIK